MLTSATLARCRHGLERGRRPAGPAAPSLPHRPYHSRSLGAWISSHINSDNSLYRLCISCCLQTCYGVTPSDDPRHTDPQESVKPEMLPDNSPQPNRLRYPGQRQARAQPPIQRSRCQRSCCVPILRRAGLTVGRGKTAGGCWFLLARQPGAEPFVQLVLVVDPEGPVVEQGARGIGGGCRHVRSDLDTGR